MTSDQIQQHNMIEGDNVTDQGRGSTLLELAFPEARLLTELWVLEANVKHSVTALKLLHDNYCHDTSNDEEGRTIAAALYRDAIVQFMSCFDFKKNKRGVLLDSDEVYSSVDGGSEYFKMIKDTRDAFAAHSFGMLRQLLLGVYLDDSGKIGGFERLNVSFTVPTKEGVVECIKFMSFTGSALVKKINDLGLIVKAKAEAMSLEELATLKTAEVRIGGHEDFGLSRGQYKGSSSPRG